MLRRLAFIGKPRIQALLGALVWLAAIFGLRLELTEALLILAPLVLFPLGLS